MSRDHRLFLEDIAEACEQTSHFIAGMTREQFLADDKTRSAVERQVFVIAEACNQVPDEIQRRHPEIPWRQIIGLRNVLAHGYWRIDPNVLWSTATERVPELREQVRAMLSD